ncbi:MAG: DUF4118 domain-containing protein [Bryobacteraceae bacterium]
MSLNWRFERSKAWAVGLGLALGAASVALQRILAPVLGPDSYQLLLSAVAIGVMYAGIRAGVSALLVTGLAKLLLFLPRESSLHLSDIRLLVRFGFFLVLGLLICWLGQKLHASQRKLRVMSGLLPICAWCKRIRDEKDQWQQLESYISDHSEADFTHGMCPDCARRLSN